MNMLDLMNKMTQLSEAKEKTKTGLKHTAEPGGYGRKDDEDDEGHKVKAHATKKGKGRPKRDADDSGETKKYDFSAFGVKSGKDVELPKHDKKKTTVVKGKSQSHADNKKDDGTDPEEHKSKAKKKGLKEYFDLLNKAIMNEDGITVKPMPGASQIIGADGKPMGTADAATANTIKQASEKGTLKLGGETQVNELDAGTVASYQDKAFDKYMGGDEKRAQGLDRASKKQAGAFGHVPTTKPQNVNEKDIGKHNNATTGFDALVRKLTPKYGVEAAKRIAGAQMKKIKEADQPPNDSLMSPMSEARAKADDKAEKAGKKVTKDLEYDMKHKGKDDNKAEKAGKKVTKDIEYDEKKKTNEAKKPDANKNGIPDYAEDGKGKNDLKKKKVKEGMEHKLKAARHTGKAHALSKQSYNCNYDDMEESRHYHDGFKEGLDECYGQTPMEEGAGLGAVGAGIGALAGGPIGAVIGGGLGGSMEEGADSTVDDMASFGAHTPEIADEGNAFTDKLRKTPDGGTFRMGRNTYTDRSSIEESPFAFEAWEKELNSILEGKDVTEGMTVSISKGQQGSPDSVSVSAQDSEADQLLSIIKQAGLGLFGGDDAGHPHASQPMTVDVDGGEGPQANIEVVDDHDDMLSLIRKMTGQGPAQSNGDYEEEGGHEGHGHKETCESCGSTMQEGHSCGESIEEDEIDDGEENETMDQREYEVAEGEEVVNNNDEAEEEQSDATRDAALAQAAGKNFADTDSPLEEDDDENIQPHSEWHKGDGVPDGLDEEEDLEESLANGADDTFEADINFMTKVISDGLNGQKSTGQTTIPVVSTQVNRLGNPMRESTDLLTDWRKLSGIK